MAPRPPGRDDARHPAQRGHLQTGVIGKRRQPGRGKPVPGLGKSVLLERGPGLRRLIEGIDVIEGHQLQPGNPGTVKHPA